MSRYCRFYPLTQSAMICHGLFAGTSKRSADPEGAGPAPKRPGGFEPHFLAPLFSQRSEEAQPPQQRQLKQQQP